MIIVLQTFVSFKEIIDNSAKKEKKSRQTKNVDLPPTTPLLSKTPSTALSERSEKRRRKPALDESEFELSPTVAKRRKPTSCGNVAISESSKILNKPKTSLDGSRIPGQDELVDLAQEQLANPTSSESSGMNICDNNNEDATYSAEFPEDEFFTEPPLSPQPRFVSKIEPGTIRDHS